jgi:hypothetical protein
MHYLYLPVRIPTTDPGLDLDSDPTGQRSADVDAVSAIPKRLAFLHEPVMDALADARRIAPHLANPYAYVTARGGFATPGSPIDLPSDDQASMAQVQRRARRLRRATSWIRVEDGPTNTLRRLTSVRHPHHPVIPTPGGMRSFQDLGVDTPLRPGGQQPRPRARLHLADVWPAGAAQPARRVPEQGLSGGQA